MARLYNMEGVVKQKLEFSKIKTFESGIIYIYILRQYSSVGIVIRLRAGQPINYGIIAVWGERFYSAPNRSAVSRAQPTSYLMGKRQM
jgi:hypothetical protein